jgi:hypothetical protein
MSRGYQQNAAGEWEPFDDDIDGFDGSPESNNIAALTAEVVLLRNALEAIDAVAVAKKAGAAKKMQAIARAALHAHQ